MHVRKAFPFVPESHVRCRIMACLLCVCLERGALLVGGFVPRPGRMALATKSWALHCWRTVDPSSSLASPRDLAQSWVPHALCRPVATACCVCRNLSAKAFCKKSRRQTAAMSISGLVAEYIVAIDVTRV